MSKETQLVHLHNLAIEKNYNQLLKELRPFIYKLVNKYQAGNDHDKDMIQCGRIGLYNAMQTYDPNKSTNFFSHAYTYIKKEMLLYFNNHKRTVKVPASQLNPNHAQHNKNLPTDTPTLSLSTPIENTNDTLADTLVSDYMQAAELDDLAAKKLELLSLYLLELKPQYQRIITLRYLEGKTLQEVGDVLGTSKEAVRQQESNALKKLQERFKI